MHTEQDRREWLAKTTNSDNLHAISVKTGLSVTALRHRNNTGMTLSAEQVIAIARAYHADPLVGLVVFDKLTERETQKMTADQTLETIPARRLADELVARVSRYQENQTKPATQEPAENPV